MMKLKKKTMNTSDVCLGENHYFIYSAERKRQQLSKPLQFLQMNGQDSNELHLTAGFIWTSGLVIWLFSLYNQLQPRPATMALRVIL